MRTLIILTKFFLASLSLSQACATIPAAPPTFKSTEDAERYLRQTKTCPGCDLRKAELSYVDLKGADLRGANLRGADLNHADLRDANLRGATLIRADLSTETLLQGADLRDTNLTEANIQDVQLGLALTCGAVLPNGTRSMECAPPIEGKN